MWKYFMKRFFIFFLIFLLFGCSSKKDSEKKDILQKLEIYLVTDQFSEELWEKTIPVFEDLFLCQISITKFNESRKLLKQVNLEMEKGKPVPDVLVGIDDVLLAEIQKDSILISYEPNNLKNVEKRFKIKNDNILIPFCYKYLAFIYHSEMIDEFPKTFGVMQDGRWNKKIIITDPRSTSSGFGLLLWSIAAFNETGYRHFWKSLKKNIFTISLDHNEACNLFLAKEAPVMLGFSSFPFYMQENENITNLKAFIPEEGGFCISECAGIINTSGNIELASQFIEYLLSEDFQMLIPKYKWMFPVHKDIELSIIFETALKPEKDLSGNLRMEFIRENSEDWLKRWEKIMK